MEVDTQKQYGLTYCVGLRHFPITVARVTLTTDNVFGRIGIANRSYLESGVIDGKIVYTQLVYFYQVTGALLYIRHTVVTPFSCVYVLCMPRQYNRHSHYYHVTVDSICKRTSRRGVHARGGINTGSPDTFTTPIPHNKPITAAHET